VNAVHNKLSGSGRDWLRVPGAAGLSGLSSLKAKLRERKLRDERINNAAHVTDRYMVVEHNWKREPSSRTSPWIYGMNVGS
jgi:hypothetical protein